MTIVKSQDFSDENDFVLGLEENAMDSLAHAVEHLLANEKTTDLKYTVLHTFHAIELFLKARLAKAHPTLIYKEPEKAGDNAQTVAFEVLTGRLHKAGVELSKQDLDDLNSLRKFRNSIEHHRLNANSEKIEDYVGRAMRFLETFLQSELDITLKNNLDLEIYNTLLESLYSYEERKEKAEEDIQKRLPSGLKDRMLYQVAICNECGEETVLVPDPNSQDGTSQCSFCNTHFYIDECGRCNSIILSLNPPEENDEIICDICWDQIADYD